MTAYDTTDPAQYRPVVQLGRHQVPEDWPVKGEASRSFAEKLKNGFFSAYMAGDVIIDVGYRGYEADPVPIFPHAIGVDLGFPGYDGITLPFPDDSADAVYSSHALEHIADYKAAIGDWHRVLKPGGFIICVVPHQFLYEKRCALPSAWNADHKRFYTPASLLREFEEALEPNTYRVRHLRDCDDDYTYSIGPERHAGGRYEIETVVEKIRQPEWSLAGDAEMAAAPAGICEELSSVAAQRDRFAAESARWFDAAIIAAAERILETQPRPRPALLWRRLGPWIGRSPFAEAAGTEGSPLARARSAAGAQRWERAARFYLDALLQAPRAAALWNELGHVLERAGKNEAAEFVHQCATQLDAGAAWPMRSEI